MGLKGDKTHMRSSVWKESSAMCKLSFWYYISHMTTGTIRLLIKVKRLDLTRFFTCAGRIRNDEANRGSVLRTI